ncbi:hypothetical protein [Sporisorium scitamineum]|uniref:Uncharacterized protein n=1 Tax=Sporisorium scitamineum TaxID=49012 RepID=A0A0F7SCX5_9BASI|nr:hypothetical protein [Sporisorium scitamineum]
MWAVGFTIISPQTLPGPPWHFTNVQVGLSFIAAAVGALIGLFAGAYALLPHTVLLSIGLVLYGIGYSNKMKWSVGVIGGIGIYYVCVAAAGAILQTYIIESFVTKAVHGIALFNFAIVTAVLTPVTLAILLVFGAKLRHAQKMVSTA